MGGITDDPGFKWLRQGATSRLPRTRGLKTKSGTVICYRTGSENTSPAERASSRMTVEDRFRARLKRVSNGCWLWTGSLDPDGYGRFFLGKVEGKTKIVFAHRWAYRHFVGTIPDGYLIDHIAEVCGHRNCVNPKHLQAVPPGVNAALGHAGRRATFCRHSHDMDEVGRRPDGTCAECARERLRRFYGTRRQDPEYRQRRAAYARARRAQRSVATLSTSSPSTL